MKYHLRIPYDLFNVEELNLREIAVISFLMSLSQSFDHITISNRKIAKTLNTSTRNISRIIVKLDELEYIDSLIFHRTLRTIKLTSKTFQMFDGVYTDKKQKKGTKRKFQPNNSTLPWLEQYETEMHKKKG